eukprot:Pgem_evm1s6855
MLHSKSLSLVAIAMAATLVYSQEQQFSTSCGALIGNTPFSYYTYSSDQQNFIAGCVVDSEYYAKECVNSPQPQLPTCVGNNHICYEFGLTYQLGFNPNTKELCKASDSNVCHVVKNSITYCPVPETKESENEPNIVIIAGAAAAGGVVLFVAIGAIVYGTRACRHREYTNSPFNPDNAKIVHVDHEKALKMARL